MNSDYDDLTPPVGLTPVERQTFILLHTALQHLDMDEADYHARMVEVLTNGFTMEYEDLFTPYSELPKADCKLVFDILDMFTNIKSSIARLDPADRDAVLAEHEYALVYQGLDRNDAREGRMASYVTFVQSTGRWTELREDVEAADGGNSHAPMLSRYQAMLDVYRPVREQKTRNFGGPRSYLLDADELRRIAETRG
jgi:uncharacterized protein